MLPKVLRDNHIYQCFSKWASHIKIYDVSLMAIIITLALCFFDIYDIPSKGLSLFPIKTTIFLSFALLVLIICQAARCHLFDLVCMPIFNISDTVLASSIGASLFYIVFLLITQASPYKWKVICALTIIAFSLGAIIFRSLLCYAPKEQTANHLYDLRDIYYGNIRHNKNEPILILEKDVDYDLLGRNVIIDQLFLSIASIKASDHAFVIGLEGEWG